MSLQIKGKFIDSTAIDGDKLLLQSGQAVRVQVGVDGNGDPIIVRLIEQDVSSGKVLVNGASVAIEADLLAEVAAREAADTALSTSIQQLIQAEADAREAAITAVETSLSAEEAARIAGDADLQSQIDAMGSVSAGSVQQVADDLAVEVAAREAGDSALQTALDAEEAARIAGDAATLASANSYTDSQVAALVDSAPELLNTLKELSDALGGDENFATTIAGQIAAVQAEVDAEEVRAAAAEAAIAQDLADEEARALAAEAALQSAIDTEVADRVAAVSAEVSAREAADLALQSEIDAEESRALAAEGVLQDNIDAEETRALAAESALSGRVSTIEGRLHRKEKFVVSAQDITNGYIDLAYEAMENSIVASVGRLMIQEGASDDYTVSVVGGVTRITFVGNMVSPSPEALAAGDILFVKYMNV
jgi:hypothetical protein